MAFKRNITRRNFLMASVVAIPMSQFILRDASAAYVTEMAAPDLNDYTPTFLMPMNGNSF